MNGSAELCFITSDEALLNEPSSTEPRRLSHTPSFRLSSGYMRPGMCSMYCRCKCHQLVENPFSERTESLLLRLFTYLQGKPRLVRSCDVFDCRASLSGRARVVVVHARLFKKMMKVSALAERFRIKLSLKSHPVAQDSSEIIRYSEAGDFRRLEGLISKGLASPFTAGSDGWTLLHVGLRLSDL